jgi:hypothetical protein
MGFHGCSLPAQNMRLALQDAREFFFEIIVTHFQAIDLV